jgi:Uma2 family endonuclease
MSTAKPRSLLRIEYEEAAEAYLRSLPPEHFMEATPQAKQREITMESLALVHAARPEVQYFNELLVQYPREEHARPGQVVPDNMVVVWPEPLDASGSYDLPLQPARPFWMLEYVSKTTKRKDYEDNFKKYEQELQVPYYLLFYPQIQELSLYRHDGSKYVSVLPNERGRFPLPELELEVALLGGWVRYWHRGELLPLPPELVRNLEKERRLRQQAERGREEAERRAELEQRRAEENALRTAEEKRGREQAERRAEEQTRLAEEQARLAAEEKRGREEERQARLALERRLAELEAQSRQRPSPPDPPA